MEFKKFRDTYMLRVQRGDDIFAVLTDLCQAEHITFAAISGIGAMDEVECALYCPTDRDYQSHIFRGMLEMTSLTGNVTLFNDEIYLHLHANFARDDCTVIGGHLIRAVVAGTAEIFIRTLDGTVNRTPDHAETGLNLIHFS